MFSVEIDVCFVPEADVRGSAARSHMLVEYLGPRPNTARSGMCAARDWVAGRKPNEIPRDNNVRPESIPPFELRSSS
jgi:hypothetical protein